MQVLFSESQVLIGIEAVVDAILSKQITNTQLLERLIEISSSLDCFDNRSLVYSQKVTAFIDALEVCLIDYDGFLEDCHQVQLNRFKSIVHMYAETITDEMASLKTQESSNKSKLERYVTQLLTHYGKTLIVRIDLGYLKGAQHAIGIEQVQSDLSKLIRCLTNKRRCFKDWHVQGYAWALEQGKDKGYHCHLLLLFDGAKHQKDWHLGMQLGQLWQDITQQHGTFFCCNEPSYKRQYLQAGKLGIGMIHRNNPTEVANAINTAAYLVNPEKSDQFLRARTSKRMKTFATGVFNKASRRAVQRTYDKVAAL